MLNIIVHIYILFYSTFVNLCMYIFYNILLKYLST